MIGLLRLRLSIHKERLLPAENFPTKKESKERYEYENELSKCEKKEMFQEIKKKRSDFPVFIELERSSGITELN